MKKSQEDKNDDYHAHEENKLRNILYLKSKEHIEG